MDNLRLRDIFRLEALDTRLEPRPTAIKGPLSPPLWRTREFYIYGVIFLVTVPQMFMGSIRASGASSANYALFSDRLSDGFFGLKMDNTDPQYATFRGNLLALTGGMIAHTTLRRVFTRLGLTRQAVFNNLFALVFLFVLHGLSVFKIFLIVGINYAIAKHEWRSQYKWMPGLVGVTWIFNVTMLIANELAQGYRFGWISPTLAGLDQGIWGGMLRRWDVNFNFTMLRLVSFNLDYNESRQLQTEPASKSTPEEIKDKPNYESESESDRIKPLPVREYSLANLFSYSLYTPLYLAGPIITFNDFMRQSQRTRPLLSITPRRLTIYALRFLICLFTMEALIHCMYVNAVTTVRAWEGTSPFEISMVGYFSLNFIWLKLLLPWRFFRLWSLLDGIDPPENMIRCMSDNYSVMSFWRAWHRSFNKWVARYLYIPLGGNRNNRPIVNSLVVFMFVALWHDIQLRLLIWGWLIVLFILPQVIADKLFPASKWSKTPEDRQRYRHLCAAGAVVNIWLMMIANLVGFCVGLDGILDMLWRMVGTTEGVMFVVTASVALWVGVQVMFEWRQGERRRGIDLRC
ncbi:MBOAT-domain-containing protein [Nadsonia fulvescens var. elongata DSM 6958]|uniref:MBOAT-domain-containing protein n=1 Tax=Nadsonia fulvescens var. elongata DSM 6958 TaxID=857566 RepID=A0A1E3PN17_9ASCO|nr:MBOAT-domain-containing protein [Nadsonia fulvescens var. elongata DSM 6958]